MRLDAYTPPQEGMGLSDCPYANDADCNEPDSYAMRWFNDLQAGRTVKPLQQPLTYVDHDFAKEPHRRTQPSDQAIARAVWGFSHCQFHDYDSGMCGNIESIIADAESIDRGLPSNFDRVKAHWAEMETHPITPVVEKRELP